MSHWVGKSSKLRWHKVQLLKNTTNSQKCSTIYIYMQLIEATLQQDCHYWLENRAPISSLSNQLDF